jgi:hypothetical protein
LPAIAAIAFGRSAAIAGTRPLRECPEECLVPAMMLESAAIDPRGAQLFAPDGATWCDASA